MRNIDIDIDIDKEILENIDIDKEILENIDIEKKILENNDIDKEILQNIDIDKISISIKYRSDSNLAYRTGLYAWYYIYKKNNWCFDERFWNSSRSVFPIAHKFELEDLFKPGMKIFWKIRKKILAVDICKNVDQLEMPRWKVRNKA